jgi:homoserine trans-succinylase
VAIELKEHMSMNKSKLLELLDELLELLELHVRNSLNICLSGGMLTILDIIFNNPHEEARREACGIFSFTNQNNVEV